MQERSSAHLAQQRFLPQSDLRSLLRLPSREKVERLPMVVALLYMFGLDVARAFRIARLRRHALSITKKFTTLGGVLPTRYTDLERTISIAREESSLAKRALFLARTQQVFHLWHVVHKPFSYSFAALALVHIIVVMLMGYF